MSSDKPPSNLNALELLAWEQSKQWKCDICMVLNKKSDYRCKSCNEPRPGFEEKCQEEPSQKKSISSNGFTFQSPAKQGQAISTSTFSFNSTVTTNTGGFQFTRADSAAKPATTFTFGSGNSGSSAGFQFSPAPASPKKPSGGFTFGTQFRDANGQTAPDSSSFHANASSLGPFTPGTSQRFTSLTVAQSTQVVQTSMDVDDQKDRELPEPKCAGPIRNDDSSDEDMNTSSDEETNAELAKKSFSTPKDKADVRKHTKNDLRKMRLRRHLTENLSRIPPGTSVICATGDGSMNGVLGLGCDDDNLQVASNFPSPIPQLYGQRIDLIATGAMSCAGLTCNNELYVWGSNEHGELGENPLDMPDLGNEDDVPADRAQKQIYEEYKRRLLEFYAEDPAKVEGFLEKYKENLHALYEKVCKKYGADPKPIFKPSLTQRERNEIRRKMLNPTKYLAHVTDDRDFARRASCIYWTPARMRIPQDIRVASIDFGAAHVVILDEDGIVYSMGTFNSDGLVGHHYIEQEEKLVLFERSFFKINDLLPGDHRSKELKPIRQISCGANHFLMLDDNNDVYQMGVTQLGQRTSVRNQKLYLRPHQVSSIMHNHKRVKFSRIRCGDHHNMAISTTGELFGWGQNNFLQCGVVARARDYNSVVDQPRHVKFPEQIRVIDVQCGQHFSIVLDERGRVWSFGRNACNQLGRKTTRPPKKNMNGRLIRQECEMDLPEVVPDLDEIDLVAAGATFWFARSKADRRKVVVFGFAKLGCCGVGNWHAAGGRCVFDSTILPDDFYVSGIRGGSNHSMFLLERADPNAVDSGREESVDGMRRKKRSRDQMERDSISPPDMKSPPKKSQRTDAKKVASRTKSRRHRRRKSAR